MTKTILIALIAALASPAFAAPKEQQTQRNSTYPRHDVYVGGQYIGSDPDPMMRFEIQREGF